MPKESLGRAFLSPYLHHHQFSSGFDLETVAVRFQEQAPSSMPVFLSAKHEAATQMVSNVIFMPPVLLNVLHE